MKFWIARSKYGVLDLFIDKPTLVANEYWDSDKEKCDLLHLSGELFPEVTFENSPQQVEIKLI